MRYLFTFSRLQNARLANRITLHLALGGSFDTVPAVEPPNTTALTLQ